MKVYNPPKPPRCKKCGLFQGFAGMHTRTCQCPEYLNGLKSVGPPHKLVGEFDEWAANKYPSRIFNLCDKELAAEFAEHVLTQSSKEKEYVTCYMSVPKCHKCDPVWAANTMAPIYEGRIKCACGNVYQQGMFFQECTSCEKAFDIENMPEDDAGNYFCRECYKELAPVMKAEYDELVKKGEIEKPDNV